MHCERGHACTRMEARCMCSSAPVHAPATCLPRQALAHSGEQQEALEREVAVHRAVQRHPNILPLLAAGSSESVSQYGGVVATTCMLFPVYSDGTLSAEVERLHSAGSRLRTAHVLDLFLQASAQAAPRGGVGVTSKWVCRVGGRSRARPRPACLLRRGRLTGARLGAQGLAAAPWRVWRLLRRCARPSRTSTPAGMRTATSSP